MTLRLSPSVAALALSLPLLGSTVLAQHSVARQWNDELLESIRRDFARPTVHARNLYHTSVAMWDAWATFDPNAECVLFTEDHSAHPSLPMGLQALREEAISHACYNILKVRFATSPGASVRLPAFDALMATLGYNPMNISTSGNSAAAIGNRIAQEILAYGQSDGANEANDYANRHYTPINPPLLPALPGNPNIVDPDRWQPLVLQFFVDQAGNPIIGGFPEFLSPEWGQVKNFSLSQRDLTVIERSGFDYWTYHDPGAPPAMNTPTEAEYKLGFEMVSVWSSHLDPADGVMIDASPNAIGNATLPTSQAQWDTFYDFANGGDASQGYTVNPVTGQPYPVQMVPRGDYGRVLAEFWADGPDSETPPGHWFDILNHVSDDPLLVKRLNGQGPVLPDLEWDVKCYLALGGAMHDAAITAWGVKGRYDFIRPVSAIRYLADLGQSSDPTAMSYHPDGITLHPGLIELVTPATTAMGQRHAHLAGEEGKIAVYAWRGPDYINDPMVDVAGVGWILAENWWPYQRPSFVTPPFAGYVSGHSTFSRAAAVIMDRLTGSPYFPGGLGEFVCPQNQFLVFEDGPSVDVRLQWASYYDASDQCSLSRIWGGIHPRVDDIPGRVMGQAVGEDAFAVALGYFDGTVRDRAAFETSGAGCPGSNGSVELAVRPEAMPVLGSSMSVDVRNLPNAASATFVGIGFSRFAPGVALDAIGMPGCVLDVDSLDVALVAATNGEGTWNLTIPDRPALHGNSVYAQAITLDPGANLLGITTSELGEATLGR